MNYNDTDNLTTETFRIIIHFQLVRLFKSILTRAVDNPTDTAIMLKFLDLIYVYGFITHDELSILRDYKNTLAKEKHNA